MTDTKIGTVLSDPDYFLHRVDVARQELVFVPTSADTLRAATFLDGRSDFSLGREQRIGWDEIGAHMTDETRHAPHYLFHVAFCGSTVLARMLDHPGKTICLREPQALVDLADWKAAQGRKKTLATAYPHILELTQLLLFRRWSAQECVVIKATNWINNQLTDMLGQPDGKAVLIDMDDRAYLRAVLRGGRDRLAYAARATAHLASAFASGEDLLGQAITGANDPVEKTVRLALLGLRLQRAAYGRLIDCWPKRVLRIAEADISASLTDSARRCSMFLGLDLDDEDIAAAAKTNAARHSKQAADYDKGTRNAQDDEVERRYRGMMDRSESWMTGITLGQIA